jgi:thioredoxin-related protein
MMILMGIGGFIGLLLGMFIYYYYGKFFGNNCDCSKIKKTDGMSNGSTIYWFHRPGCPHCENMKGAWKSLEQQMPNHNLVSVNTALPQNQALSAKYGVKGVPHIVKVDSSGNQSVYKGARTTADMKKWVLN